jgi:hypothetical protein
MVICAGAFEKNLQNNHEYNKKNSGVEIILETLVVSLFKHSRL